jgi:putative holliday junction resolvase
MTTAATPSPPDPLPRRGVLMGIDHGLKRIGVAVTDVQQTLAMPLVTVAAKSPVYVAGELRRLREEYGGVGWVVGLPLHMTGDESAQSQHARRFGAWLETTFKQPVLFWDERLSSSQAETVLWSLGASPSRDKAQVDRLAAQAILESYLRDRTATPT